MNIHHIEKNYSFFKKLFLINFYLKIIFKINFLLKIKYLMNNIEISKTIKKFFKERNELINITYIYI